MATDKRSGKRLPDWVRREDTPGVRIDSGPFIGIVKNNNDPTRSGRLQVWIPNLGGDEKDVQSWRTVGYASPFFGSTYKAPTNNSQNNKFDEVLHTYGMWAVPPDLGNHVICTFIAGDPGKGYWFACVNPNLSQHMVPALGSSTNVDNTKTSSTIKSKYNADTTSKSVWPVVEFNQEVVSEINAAFATNVKPVHEFQANVLLNQGLDRDSIRGAIPSSSQRESPSTVFGISTPGRPMVDPADNPEYEANMKAGTLNDAYVHVQARKGGHTFVMDDGDVKGNSQVVRLRTAGGHQILMNDSEQVLYIANNNGTAWIEFTAGGHMNMYSQGGMNLRTEGEFNVHADKDINLNSKTNININAGSSIKSQTPVHTAKANTMTLQAGTMGILSTGDIKIQGATGSYKTSGDLVLKGSKIFFNTTTPADVTPVTDLTKYKQSDTSWDTKKGIWISKPDVFESIATVTPAHEPWKRKATVKSVNLYTPPPAPEEKISGMCTPQTADRPVRNVVPTKGLPSETMLENYLRSIGVTDQTKLASIMAQCSHESGAFKYSKELGNDAYFDKYEPVTSIGKRLGNTQPGDGAKYKGRGFIQITGRYNYTKASTSLGIDLVGQPQLAEDPQVACKLVDWFFFTLNGSRTANLDWSNIPAVTKIVNGGINGLADRQAKYNSYKSKYAAGFVTSGNGSVVVDGSGNPVTSGKKADPGPDSAKGKQVSQPANVSLMSRPDAPNPALIAPAGSVPGLLSKQVKALMVEIGFAEGNLNYTKSDPELKRLGRYQINGNLLKDYGYVTKADAIYTNSSWTGKDNIKSAEDWLNNYAVQEKVMEQILQDYYKTMTTQQAITVGDDVCMVAGMLSVAYFFRDFTAGLTTGNPTSQAKFWRQQATQTNKQGVPGHIPYNQGRYAIDVLSVQEDAIVNPPDVTTDPTESVSGIDPASVINFTANSGNRAHYDMLGASIRNSFEQMAKEFKEKTGRKITLNSAVRTFEEQTKIYNAFHAAAPSGATTKNVPGIGNISMPAKPSQNSPHVRGVAFDISKADLQICLNSGLLDKYNFKFPFPKDDPVHIQTKTS